MRSMSEYAFAAMLALTAGCDAAGLVYPPDAPAASGVVPSIVSCGASIVADFQLGNDLSCPGDALFVDASNVSIDLNGHSIVGSGVGVGITVRLRQNVLVRGGVISGFVTGVFVAQSNQVTITENRLTQNREAIFLNGTSNSKVKRNVAWANQLRGVMLRPTAGGVPSTANLVDENELANNPSGILVFGQSGNTIHQNWIYGSSFAALDLTGPTGGTGNLIRDNRLEGSAAGIRFGPGWTGNSFVENRISNNVCGTAGTSTGNKFKENVFVGNATDVC